MILLKAKEVSFTGHNVEYNNEDRSK